MATQTFKLKHGNMNHFVDFATKKPYSLVFSNGSKDGNITWGGQTVPFVNDPDPIKNAFTVTYNPDSQKSIVDHIAEAVTAYNKQSAT